MKSVRKMKYDTERVYSGDLAKKKKNNKNQLGSCRIYGVEMVSWFSVLAGMQHTNTHAVVVHFLFIQQ